MEDLAWHNQNGAVRSHRMKVLVPFSNACGARGPLAQCLRMLARKVFFATKHARLRRASAAATLYCCCRNERERSAISTRSHPWIRGLPHVAENIKV